MQDYPTGIQITKVEQVTIEIDQPAIGCNSQAPEIKQPDQREMERTRHPYSHRQRDARLGAGSWATTTAEEAQGVLNQIRLTS